MLYQARIGIIFPDSASFLLFELKDRNAMETRRRNRYLYIIYVLSNSTTILFQDPALFMVSVHLGSPVSLKNDFMCMECIT